MTATRAILRPFDKRESSTIARAAARAGVTPDTMTRWCAKYGLGRKIGGLWFVSRIALAMHLDGNYAALRTYHSGDREGELVTQYFRREGIVGILHVMTRETVPQFTQNPHGHIAHPGARAHIFWKN